MGRFARSIWLLGWVVLLVLASPTGCGHKPPPPTMPVEVPVVRVRVMQDKSQIKLSATQPPVVRASGGAPRLINISPTGTSLTLDSAGWHIGSLQLDPGDLLIEPATDGSVKVDGVAYHGQYHFVPGTANHFDVVNHVSVEAYLKGVLAREMYPDFHNEAFAAQAIVARTYALWSWRHAPSTRAWDLQADTRSQMYGGIGGETDKSRWATDATAGVVVAYGPEGQEKIFKAFFSSCCGGAGQSAADAFGESPTEPLTDRAVGQQCADPANKRFQWAPVVISKDELTRRFRLFAKDHKRPAQNIGPIDRIDIARVNPSGRPVQFAVSDARGGRFLISGEDLRLAVNTDAPESSGTLLWSSYVSPVADGSTIRFENGHGFGHGVGMCQWCAQAQAKRGVRHEDIVTQAYKGSKLVRAY